MVNLPLELSNYAIANDYYWLTETPSGSNQQLDKFLSSKKEFALYYNIIEDGVISTSSNGRLVTMERSVELTMLKKDVKEDFGKNYLPILQELIEKQLLTYSFVLSKVEFISSATYQTAVDTNDACLAMCRLTINYQDTLTIC